MAGVIRSRRDREPEKSRLKRGLLMGAGRGAPLFAVTTGGMIVQICLAWLLSSAFGLIGIWVAMGVAAAGQLAATLGFRQRRRPGRLLPGGAFVD